MLNIFCFADAAFVFVVVIHGFIVYGGSVFVTL